MSEAPMATDPDVSLALDTLRDVARDATAPAAARGQAARTLLEAKGVLGRHAEPPPKVGDAPVSSLSRQALEAELASLRRTGSAPGAPG